MADDELTQDVNPLVLRDRMHEQRHFETLKTARWLSTLALGHFAIATDPDRGIALLRAFAEDQNNASSVDAADAALKWTHRALPNPRWRGGRR